MSERRENSRQNNEPLWDKTFNGNEDIGKDGHLSRTEHRKKREHNSTITTVLIVIIIILAAFPLIYWINHKEALDHPVRTEQVAQSSKKKAHSSSTKRVKSSSSSAKAISSSSSLASSSVSSSSTSTSSAASASSSSEVSGAKYVTVQRNGSIYRIAAQNGITVNQLMQLNGLNLNSHLSPGQQLRVR